MAEERGRGGGQLGTEVAVQNYVVAKEIQTCSKPRFTRIPLCRLCDRLDDLISEPTRAVGATVTEGTVILIGLPRMAS